MYIVAAWRIRNERLGNRQIADEGEHECDLDDGFHGRLSFQLFIRANCVPIDSLLFLL